MSTVGELAGLANASSTFFLHTMNEVRFITNVDQVERLNDHLVQEGTRTRSVHGLEVEKTSLQVIQQICQESAVSFSLIGIDKFLREQPTNGISLLLDADVEPVVYGNFVCPPIPVDGTEIVTLIQDKFAVYRTMMQARGILQPRTEIIHNHHDVEGVLSKIKSERVVIKPRNGGHSSRNVLMLNRSRLEDRQEGEIFNFHDCILQEYAEDALWPPIEWRLHFVGRALCRCLRTTDKNNWSHEFRTSDVDLDNIPAELEGAAVEASRHLAGERNRDNFTLDFLQTKNGFVFLEANCGALGSFYVDSPEKKPFLIPMFQRMFRRYFKKKK